MQNEQGNVAVAGGGIAGLSAALALARTGWRTHVFEQVPAFAEVGAGVQLGPNVTRILRAWGLESELSQRACQPEWLMARSALTGDVLACLDLSALAARHGAPYATIHRADLHALLCQAALAAGASLHTGCAIDAVSPWPQGVALRLAMPLSETPNVFDAAVVADGVWSRLRPSLLADGAPHWSGHIAYRALMPMSALPVSMRGHEIMIWMGPDVHLVCYPVSGGERLNVVCLVETGHTGPLPVQDWEQQSSPEQTRADLHRALRHACPDLRALIDACEGWRWWPLYARPAVRGAHEMVQGRIALIGDAAHPMLPYLAQGAGMAIEDAQVLAACLHEVAAQDETRRQAGVPAALQAFAEARWARNARVQMGAQRNGHVFHVRGPLRWGRDLGLRLLGASLMEMPWLYGYVASSA